MEDGTSERSDVLKKENMKLPFEIRRRIVWKKGADVSGEETASTLSVKY